MLVSDYIKKYFAPVPRLRTRDVLREVPGAFMSTGSKILGGFQKSGQSFFRGVAGLGSTLTGRTLTPSTYFQKQLYGTDKPLTARSFGEEVGVKGKLAPVAGFALSAFDLIPGGQVSKRGAVTLLKNTNKADDAFRILTKTMGVARDVATKYLDDAVRLTDTKQLTSLVDKIVNESQQVSRFIQKGKDIAKKTRGFISSAKEVIPEANRIAGQYIPRGTDQLAIKAKNLINTDFAQAERMALTGSDDSAVAVASELLKKYADDAAKALDPVQANALYDRAADVANTLAPKLTEQGRAIQAASILGRLTPEGQVRFAAREIQKYNEINPTKRIAELTGEQAKLITDEMKAINAMAEGTEKAMRFQKLQNMIQDLVPTPLIKKVIAVWKAGLLTGLKTQGLNIFSNLFHGVTEIAKDVPASIVDSAAALFTGQRTKTLTTKGLGKGVAEGFDKGIRYFKTGFDERNVGAKLDYKRVNFGKGKVAKAFQVYTDTVFRFLGSQDQPFYYGALSRSLMDQALAQGKNAGKRGKELVDHAYQVVEAPTEDMIKYAVLDATTAVFQNKTKLGEAARAIQNIPGVGEFFLPFGRTPSAVAMQIINYSPVGIAKTIIENIGKGKFDQRLFSQGIGRGLTGTAIAAIGVELAKKGLVSLDFPFGDEREQELQKAEGTKNNAIKLGDKWRSPIALGPAGNLILVGAHIQRALEESGSISEAFSKAAFGTFDSFLDQTFVTGLRNAMNAITDPETYAKSYLPNLIASFVPTVVSDVARATDPKERRPETTVERIQARVPGVRRELEPQVDVLGRETGRIGNPLEVLIDPTRPSPVTSTPVTEELRRLMDEGQRISPTKLGNKNGFKALSQEENTRLWKFTGDIVNDKLESLFSRDAYRKLSDEGKGKLIEKIVRQAKINARAGMAIELTEGLSGEKLKTKLSELKEGGLIIQEVFRKYMELNNFSETDERRGAFEEYSDWVIPPKKEKNAFGLTPSFISQAPKKNLKGFLLDLKDKLPFFESRLGKGLKEDALNSYAFTDKMKELLRKESFVKDTSPMFDMALGLSKDDGEIRVGQPNPYYGGKSSEGRVADYLPFGREVLNADIDGKLGQIGKLLVKKIGPNRIEVKVPDTLTVAHELIHAIVDKRGVVTAPEEFNKKWERVAQSDARLQAVDRILDESGLYHDLDEWSLMNERLAYLGAMLGVGGLNAFPEEFREDYAGVFRGGSI